MIEINLYKSIVESVPFSPGIQTECVSAELVAQPGKLPLMKSVEIRRIGYGHIMSPDEPLHEVTEGAARALLRLDIQKLTNWVCNHVTVTVTPQRLGALILYAYAVGRIAFKNSLLLRAVNVEDWESVDSLVRPPQWRPKTICRP